MGKHSKKRGASHARSQLEAFGIIKDPGDSIEERQVAVTIPETVVPADTFYANCVGLHAVGGLVACIFGQVDPATGSHLYAAVDIEMPTHVARGLTNTFSPDLLAQMKESEQLFPAEPPAYPRDSFAPHWRAMRAHYASIRFNINWCRIDFFEFESTGVPSRFRLLPMIRITTYPPVLRSFHEQLSSHAHLASGARR